MRRVFDRVKEASSTTGLGDFTLDGAESSFQAFGTVLNVGDKTYYTITDSVTGAWEVGLGTYSGANTLTRTQVYSSSNSNSLVNFGAGIKSVFITYTARVSVTTPEATAFAIALGG
tara:strand:+ start:443 stop:790 length:348 start_codon:yes stop_codon:yes gene_type:complete